MTDCVDTALKCVQAVFYVVAGTVAILTYRSAKNGLLNAVNTEYQKRVMDRLAKLAEELITEFDPSSDKFWAERMAPGNSEVEKIVDQVNQDFMARGDKILTKEGRYAGGIRGYDIYTAGQVDLLATDPFIPRVIRQEVVNFITTRHEAMQFAFFSITNEYAKMLVEKSATPKKDNWAWLHNRVMEILDTKGLSIPQIHERVNKFRLDIQAHMESFDPLRNPSE